MAIFNKGNVVFKHEFKDFIVEEINNDGKISKVSDSLDAFSNAKVDFGSLDINDRRDFIFFDMEKIDIDHFNAISILSNQLKKNPYEIGYAGTKDKTSWSSQRISVFNPDIERIKSFSHKNIIIKNFRWGKHKIKIGDLKGNRFDVTLRDVDKEAIKVLSRVRNTEYIPNYFGKQRFGSVRNDNFKIGKLVMKGKYKEAVFAYLTGYGEKESNEVRIAKNRLKAEKNIISAKEYFPKELYLEHKMIEYIKENEDDFIGAIMLLGEKNLLIICQSVQSKIFNLILERAIERKILSEEDTLVIPGYNIGNAESKLSKIESEVLEECGLCLEDFKNKDILELCLRSSKRKAFFKVKDISIETENDEIFAFSKKIKISFILDSGSYATTLLEYFFELR